jgi:hypothetical protein
VEKLLHKAAGYSCGRTEQCGLKRPDSELQAIACEKEWCDRLEAKQLLNELSLELVRDFLYDYDTEAPMLPQLEMASLLF